MFEGKEHRLSVITPSKLAFLEEVGERPSNNAVISDKLPIIT
jgi:hypothetical protein